MYSEKVPKFHHTLSFRLTLWYAAIFLISAGVAFLLFYLLITTVIRERMDEDLTERVGAFSRILSIDGIDTVKRVAILEAQAAGEKQIFLRLLYSSGDVFSSSNMSYWQDIGVSNNAMQRLLKGERYVFETIVIPKRKHRVRILYGIIGRGIILQVGQSMESYSRIIDAFKKIFVITTSFLFLLAVFLGWFMARRALSGVAVITQTARQISGGDLDKRVSVKARGDEIDQLGTTFNQMLDQIQTLLKGMKEMSENIAHDLKSPVTRIRGIAEVNLTTEASVDEYEHMAASIIEECDRLLDMINTMLIISRTEAGLSDLRPVEMDMAMLISDACELFHPMAEEKNVTLTCDMPEKCSIRGDLRMLQRMIANILDNAIKYTEGGGAIHLAVKIQDDGPVVISVKDTGVGITEADLPHIFERFYRCDPSRSESGTGLGLSLARTIARAHGGDITVESTPGQGSILTVVLPKSCLVSRLNLNKIST
jgi:heavy metal sensor kinase